MTRQGQSRGSGASYFVKYALILLSFVGLFHYNFVDTGAVKLQLGRLAPFYYFVVRYDKLFGLAQTWRMYSPVPRHITIARWYAQTPDGSWIPVELPSYSAEDRERRNDLVSWLRDFKRARIVNDYLHEGDRHLAGLYIDAQRQRIAEQIGFEPSSIRVVVERARIPSPEEKGDWTPWTAEFAVYGDYEFRR